MSIFTNLVAVISEELAAGRISLSEAKAQLRYQRDIAIEVEIVAKRKQMTFTKQDVKRDKILDANFLGFGLDDGNQLLRRR
jgi:hypothetical protein